MPIRFGSRVFKPGLTATVLTVVLLPVFVGLGMWQLQRADLKRSLIDQVARGRVETLSLNGTGADTLNRYQHVKTRGHYQASRQVLLDNMPSHTGRPGFRVLTPLVLEDGRILLVDRGWLPLGESREQLPELAVSEEVRDVSGLLDELPRPGLRLGTTPAVGERWPRVMNFPRYDELQALYGVRLLSRILLLDAAEPDGYEREWRTGSGFNPQRHIAYAVQWFGFALTLLVLYVVVNLKPVRNEHVRR